MLFNPDPNKQANDKLHHFSSRKTNLNSWISLELNQCQINFSEFQKYLGLVLHLGRK